MIGCLPIIALYFEFENELKFYNLEACFWGLQPGNAQTSQLQRLARILNFCVCGKSIIFFSECITNVLTRLHQCSGWSVPLLFACNKFSFFHIQACLNLKSLNICIYHKCYMYNSFITDLLFLYPPPPTHTL